jgi:hypothetical protein
MKPLKDRETLRAIAIYVSGQSAYDGLKPDGFQAFALTPDTSFTCL